MADLLIGQATFWKLAGVVDVPKITGAIETASEYADSGDVGSPGGTKAVQTIQGALKGAKIDFSSMKKPSKSIGMPPEGGGWAGWPR
jgi:hypothetical protein